MARAQTKASRGGGPRSGSAPGPLQAETTAQNSAVDILRFLNPVEGPSFHFQQSPLKCMAGPAQTQVFSPKN